MSPYQTNSKNLLLRETDIDARIAGLSLEKRTLLLKRISDGSGDPGGQQALRARSDEESLELSFASAPLVPLPRTRDLPLSFAQQRLWFLDRLLPAQDTYSIPTAWRLRGRLDVPALQRSLDQLVARHETLRTRFAVSEGEPVQVINPLHSVALPITDLSTLPQAEREARARQITDTTARQPFDLEAGPLLRAQVLRLAPEEHLLLLNVHHIISDGWSVGVFDRELSAAYDAFVKGREPELPALPIQYADYALWQREWLQGKVLQSQLDYWKNRLAGISTLELPTDRPRAPVASYKGAHLAFDLPAALSRSLKVLGQREGATLFMTLLAAFQVLLYRYSGEEDIAVGAPIAGRQRAELEGLIGFFANTLVLRVDLSGNPPFRELLARVRESAVGAYTHQDLPFEKLVEELAPARDLSRNPLFQVMFALQNAPGTALALEGVEVSRVPLAGHSAKFDLSLSVRETDEGLHARWEYASDLFDTCTIERMARHFERLLEAVVADPEQRIGRLPLLTEAERHQLLVEWNDTAADYPKDRCIHELFEDQVARTPEAVAVVFEDRQLTYAELNARANQLAHHLIEIGVSPEVLVGLCMERSLELIIGLLAILKAGGAYVPLDPSYPKNRLAFMLQDTQAPVLLTQQGLLGQLSQYEGRIVCLDRDWPHISGHSVANAATSTAAEALAYVMYTSGSTGNAKGVMIGHRALVNHMTWMEVRFPLVATDRVLQKTSIGSDASVWELFAPLISGAQLVLAAPQVHRSPADLVETAQQQAITVLQVVPSMLAAMLDESGLSQCRALRRLYCGGEVLGAEPARRLRARSNAELMNLYGPTEATIDATCHVCLADNDQTVSIGRPIANTRIYLLDGHGEPVPVGVLGEIYIGGAGLARGYLNRTELTAEKFLHDPFSDVPHARMYRTGDLARYRPGGNIEFLGRIDHQVKIRGFRIELGEIEAVLTQHPAVHEALVVAREDRPGDKRLVGYFVADGAVVIEQIRDHLSAALPDYMVPSAFVRLEFLPLTPNGKVDRRALPVPQGNRPDLKETFVAPRNPTEEILAKIWVNLLSLNQVGVHDDFFDLGGHSLLAVRLFAEIEKEFGKKPPLSSLFQRATIEHLANMITQRTPSNGSSPLVAIQPQGSKPTFFCVHEFFGDVLCYMSLARHLGEDRPFYALKARGLDGVEEPFSDIEAMAAHYIEAIQTVQPQGPYALGGLCFGGIVAFEMAQQLRAKGAAVNLVALLDSGIHTKHGSVAWWWSFLRNLPRDFPSWLIGSLQLNRAQWEILIKQKIRMTRASLHHAFRSSRNGSHHDDVLMRVQELGDFFQFSEQHRKVALAQHQALRQYQPRFYPGRLTLFRARMQPFFSSHALDKGWGKLANGGLDIRIVPGNHLGMLQEPHVRVLAEQLRSCLESG